MASICSDTSANAGSHGDRQTSTCKRPSKKDTWGHWNPPWMIAILCYLYSSKIHRTAEQAKGVTGDKTSRETEEKGKTGSSKYAREQSEREWDSLSTLVPAPINSKFAPLPFFNIVTAALPSTWQCAFRCVFHECVDTSLSSFMLWGLQALGCIPKRWGHDRLKSHALRLGGISRDQRNETQSGLASLKLYVEYPKAIASGSGSNQSETAGVQNASIVFPHTQVSNTSASSVCVQRRLPLVSTGTPAAATALSSDSRDGKNMSPSYTTGK
jgi:hypothetical protein